MSGFSLPLDPSRSPRRSKKKKMTYEEIMAPDASLNDILDFDFSGRYGQQTTNQKKA